jgi:ferredoxin-NADP reductase
LFEGNRDVSGTITLSVNEIRTECDDIVRIALIDEDGAELPAWEAGAHLDISMPGGITRQYSLCGVPSDRFRYEVAVFRDPNSRGGSIYLHDEVEKGDRLSVSTPRNHFPLKSAGGYLFIAGGIGITPIRPMIDQARSCGLPYTLAYVGRSRSAMAFLDDLSDDPDVSFHVSDENSRLDLDAFIGPSLGDEVAIYACGPTRLLDAIADRCAKLGYENRLHSEKFAGTPTELDSERESAFEVELYRTKKIVQVSPRETILEALNACGVETTSSCSEGVCGSCETPVLEGEVDHRDQILEEDERAANDTMMICCSRARSARIVLDL